MGLYFTCEDDRLLELCFHPNAFFSACTLADSKGAVGAAAPYWLRIFFQQAAFSRGITGSVKGI